LGTGHKVFKAQGGNRQTFWVWVFLKTPRQGGLAGGGGRGGGVHGLRLFTVRVRGFCFFSSGGVVGGGTGN